MNRALTLLGLGTNKITDEGAAAIAEGLIGSGLTTLSLSGNNIGDRGAEAIGKALLNDGHQLTLLHMNDNNLTEVGQKAIRDGWGNRSEITCARQNLKL